MSKYDNGILNNNHYDYLLKWHDILGDRSNVLYNAMGPDISTVLLVSNAKSITGVDPQGLNKQSLEIYLEKDFWGIIDTKPVPMADAFYYHFDKNNTVNTWISTKEEYKNFDRVLSQKRKLGYQDTGIIEHWTPERLIMIELKKLGVKRNTINICGENYSPTITFQWAYPGDKVEERMLKYTCGRLENLNIEDRYDMAYQKSLPGIELSEKCVPILKNLLNNNGIILLGAIHYSYIPIKKWKRKVRESLDMNYHEIRGPKLVLNPKTIEEYGSDESMLYGMQLFGFKKNYS